MNDISRVLQILKSRKQERFVLATVIRVQGSAYRHEGAKMLIDADGKTFGTISAGCLEQDLIQRAQEVIKAKRPKIIAYNLMSEDDLSWGQAPGCKGTVEVYVETVCWDQDVCNNGKSLWSVMDGKLDEGLRVTLGVRVTDGENNTKVLYCEDQEIYYEASDTEGESSLRFALQRFLGQDKKVSFIKGNKDAETLLLELYHPKEKLFIFGAGPDVQPLAEYASQLDFLVYLIDPRGSRCREELFPTVAQFFVEFPENYLQNNTLPPNSLILIMTHNFHWDRRILQMLWSRPPRYVGILGPRKRTERLLDSRPIPIWIHSPVGFNIHAEGPEEIAISILAELISFRKGK